MVRKKQLLCDHCGKEIENKAKQEAVYITVKAFAAGIRWSWNEYPLYSDFVLHQECFQSYEYNKAIESYFPFYKSELFQ